MEKKHNEKEVRLMDWRSGEGQETAEDTALVVHLCHKTTVYFDER